MRHVVRVLRPTKATGSLGETQGKPEVVFQRWPCSIRTLSGKEQETARQTGADAQYEIEGYGDPRKPIDESCYLELESGGTTRTFHVAFIDDEDLNQVKLRLLCGENK